MPRPVAPGQIPAYLADRSGHNSIDYPVLRCIHRIKTELYRRLSRHLIRPVDPPRKAKLVIIGHNYVPGIIPAYLFMLMTEPVRIDLRSVGRILELLVHPEDNELRFPAD